MPICVIGTDTGVGKTYTCCQIMQYLAQFNYLSATLKPIASGVSNSEYGLVNEDVYQLFKANTYPLSLKQINHFGFKEAIAPHIAAKLEEKKLNVTDIVKQTRETITQTIAANNLMPRDLKDMDPSAGEDDSVEAVLQPNLLIEGVGGLMVPLNEKETYLDVLIAWNYPIILVVGMKLGCLNHAQLTAAILRQNNLPLVGFIANQINPQMAYYDENLEYLRRSLATPLLATISYQGDILPSKAFKELFQCH